jgi:MYXO-CTERM domain-containing protein
MYNKAIGLGALLALAGIANGQVVISEVLGSTSGTDWEFIELVNLGAAPVDISGWAIELWDSDAGAQFGTLDAASPYTVVGGTVLAPGEVWVIGNSLAFDGDSSTPGPTNFPNPDGYDDGIGNESFNGVDFFRSQPFGNNSIENSSYTAVLADAGQNQVDSWFFSDGGAGDLPNRAGTVFVPNFIVPLDGSFLAPGAYRVGTSVSLLNFGQADLNNGTLAGGTPGYNQIPAPGALALAGLAGLAASRRRRA